MIVVFGGIIASTLIRFPLDNVRSAFDVASRAFFTRAKSQPALVVELVGLSQRARREGVSGPPEDIPEDPFMAQGIQMVIDRVDKNHIRDVLTSEIHATHDRHSLGQEIFRFIAGAALPSAWWAPSSAWCSCSPASRTPMAWAGPWP